VIEPRGHFPALCRRLNRPEACRGCC
jgi:hypothetical protein